MATQAHDVTGDVASTIKEQIGSLGTQMKELMDERATAQTEKLAEYDTKLDGLSKSIEKLQELQKESEAYRTDGIELGTGKEQFSFARFIYGLCTEAKSGPGVWGTKECGLEGEYLKGMRDKAIRGQIKTYSGATDAAGGHLIGTDVQAGIIELMRLSGVGYQAGMRRMDGLSSNISWNVNDGGTTAYWVDTEAEDSITESRSSFSTVNASPKPLAALSKISWLMMKQPAEAVESFIRSELATVTSLAEDSALFSGTGAAGQPRGLMNQGIDSITVDFNNDSFSDGSTTTAQIKSTFRKFRQELRANFALGKPGAKLAWVAEEAVAQDLESVLDSDGRDMYLREDEALIERLYRAPFFVNQHPAFQGTSTDRSIVHGDFNQCVVPHWGAMEFSASDSDDDDFKKGRMSVRVITALDLAVLQKNAFVEASDYGD